MAKADFCDDGNGPISGDFLGVWITGMELLGYVYIYYDYMLFFCNS